MQPVEELVHDIEACAANNRGSQKKIYTSFYGYAMSICNRYTNSYEDAIEILNDGFLKIFKGVKDFKPATADINSCFKGWLGKIMVYTAIDHNRKYCNESCVVMLENNMLQVSALSEDAIDRMSYEEIIQLVQELSPAYRTIFNLYVIEGFSHEEIASALGISVGTSKSNLSKAKKHLQKTLFHHYKPEVVKDAI